MFRWNGSWSEILAETNPQKSNVDNNSHTRYKTVTFFLFYHSIIPWPIVIPAFQWDLGLVDFPPSFFIPLLLLRLLLSTLGLLLFKALLPLPFPFFSFPRFFPPPLPPSSSIFCIFPYCLGFAGSNHSAIPSCRILFNQPPGEFAPHFAHSIFFLLFPCSFSPSSSEFGCTISNGTIPQIAKPQCPAFLQA